MEIFKPKNAHKFQIIIFCILMIHGCKDVRVENYYLPKNFEGNVAVIYSNNNTEKQEVYNYNIPDNGILKTSYKFYAGDYRINYYQKNELNEYDTLYERLSSSKLDTSKSSIYFNRVLTFNKYGSKNVYTVSTFYVGKKNVSDLAKDRFLFEKKIEEIVLAKE
jgi:hypothetical protein